MVKWCEKSVAMARRQGPAGRDDHLGYAGPRGIRRRMLRGRGRLLGQTQRCLQGRDTQRCGWRADQFLSRTPQVRSSFSSRSRCHAVQPRPVSEDSIRGVPIGISPGGAVLVSQPGGFWRQEASNKLWSQSEYQDVRVAISHTRGPRSYNGASPWSLLRGDRRRTFDYALRSGQDAVLHRSAFLWHEPAIRGEVLSNGSRTPLLSPEEDPGHIPIKLQRLPGGPPVVSRPALAAFTYPIHPGLQFIRRRHRSGRGAIDFEPSVWPVTKSKVTCSDGGNFSLLTA